jgi:hypothetical protein
MTDFFDDLERQLVAATPHRETRIRRARARRTAATLSMVVVLLAGGAGIAAAVAGSGSDGRGGPDGGPNRTPAGTTATATTPPTAAVTTHPSDPRRSMVAVLNGTTIPGLARGVANRLQNAGYKVGTVTNAATQGHATTTVYIRTQRDIPMGTQIASALRLADARGETALRQMPAGVKTLVGGLARVVVLVGSDQNHPAGP